MITVVGLLLLLPQVCVTQQAKLVPGDAFADDLFGASVDMHADRIVVGAPRHRPPGFVSRTGAAYVFERVGGSWQQRAQLVPSGVTPPIAPLISFGRYVACDAARIAVCAPDAPVTSSTFGRGLAYVFVQAGGNWVEEAVLDAADPAATEFAQSVDIDDSTAIVGNPGPYGSTKFGSAFVFVRSGPSWSKQAVLIPSDAQPGDAFGFSVLIAGNTAFVGACGADGAEPGAGAVYVFTRSGSTWTERHKLVAAQGRSGDQLGYSLALDGPDLVAGAPYIDRGIWVDVGGAHVFQGNGAVWLERQQLVAKGYVYEDHSGWSVSASGGWLALGSPGVAFTNGYAHLHSRASTGWTEHLQLAPSGAQWGDAVGQSVALADQRLAVGAWFTDAPYPNTGAVYVYEIQAGNPQPTYYCTAKPDSKGCVPRIHHIGQPSYSAALSGESYWVKGWEVQPKVIGMLRYSTAGPASLPFAGGVLCIGSPIHTTPPGATEFTGLGFPCHGQFSFDFNAWIASGADPWLVPGQPVWMQYVYRDPKGPPGANIGLTEGLFVQICP